MSVINTYKEVIHLNVVYYTDMNDKVFMPLDEMCHIDTIIPEEATKEKYIQLLCGPIFSMEEAVNFNLVSSKFIVSVTAASFNTVTCPRCLELLPLWEIKKIKL